MTDVLVDPVGASETERWYGDDLGFSETKTWTLRSQILSTRDSSAIVVVHSDVDGVVDDDWRLRLVCWQSEIG